MDPIKRIQRTFRNAREGIEDVVLGYQIAPGPERAAVAATLSFGAISLATTTLATTTSAAAGFSTTSSSRARLAASGSVMVVAAFLAALNRDDGQEARYAVPFGVGAGVALNEAPPAAGLAGAGGAALGLAGLVRDLHRRGAVHRAIRQLAGT